MYIGTTMGDFQGDYFDRFKKARSFGFEAVGLCFPAYSEVGEIWIWNLKKDDIRRLRRELQDFKRVTIHTPFAGRTGEYILSVNPKIREVVMEETIANIRLAKEIGAAVVELHMDGSTLPEAQKDAMMREVLERLNREALRCGVKLGVETGGPGCLVFPAERYALLEEWGLSDNVGITLDTGHICFSDEKGSAYRAFGTIAKFIERFRRMIVNMHIHDYDAEANDGAWPDHRPIGKGNLDFSRIIEALKRAGYEGSLIFEMHPRYGFEALLESKRRIEALLAEGRRANSA